MGGRRVELSDARASVCEHKVSHGVCCLELLVRDHCVTSRCCPVWGPLMGALPAIVASDAISIDASAASRYDTVLPPGYPTSTTTEGVEVTGTRPDIAPYTVVQCRMIAAMLSDKTCRVL